MAVQSKNQDREQSSTINNLNSILNIPVVNRSKHRLPEYQSPEASGMDLQANIDSTIDLYPQDRVTIPTGIFINFQLDSKHKSDQEAD